MSGSLQHNILDTIISEWQNRQKAHVRPDGKHFEHLLSASYQTKEVMDL